MLSSATVPAAWKKTFLLLAILAFATAASAGVVGWLTAKARNWDFVQQTGGLRIDQPVEKSGGLVLPVEYDVTGTNGVTRRATLINSGLVVRRIEASTTRNREIVLKVVTQVVEEDSDTGQRHYASLDAVSTGAYKVYYEDAGDPSKYLGKIQVR